MSIYERIHTAIPGPGAALRAPAPHGLIEVVGPDAVDFVHRLCSQDVAGLEAGRCAPAAFLSPKGKLIATAWLARDGARVVLETPREHLDALRELLDRYHFSEKLELVDRAGWTCAEVVGRASADPAVFPGPEPGSAELGAAAVTFAARRHGVRWVRRHAPAAADLGAFGAGLPALEPDLAEALRMLAGLVRVGVDTEAATLALEAALDDHVSTTKGCYVGQEIVARIHTYGHVNRRIALLALDTAEPVERGTPLCDADDGEPVGRVMSAVAIPGSATSVGLGFLPEALVDDPVPLVLGGPDGPRAQVEPFAPA